MKPDLCFFIHQENGSYTWTCEDRGQYLNQCFNYVSYLRHSETTLMQSSRLTATHWVSRPPYHSSLWVNFL